MVKQQITFVCKRDVGRQGISVFTATPPGRQWRDAVMFSTYVSHFKCVRGRWWWGGPAEMQRGASDSHSYASCVGTFRVWSLHSSGECWESFQWPLPYITSHLPPSLGYVSNICTPEKKHSPSSIGDGCLFFFFFRGPQPVWGVRRWGVASSCETRNQTVGPETDESVGLLLICAFPRNLFRCQHDYKQEFDPTVQREVTNFLSKKRKAKTAFPQRATPMLDLQIWFLLGLGVFPTAEQPESKLTNIGNGMSLNKQILVQ